MWKAMQHKLHRFFIIKKHPADGADILKHQKGVSAFFSIMKN
jgi:hypothetical protein